MSIKKKGTPAPIQIVKNSDLDKVIRNEIKAYKAVEKSKHAHPDLKLLAEGGRQALEWVLEAKKETK